MTNHTIGYVNCEYTCQKCGKKFYGNGYTPYVHRLCPDCFNEEMVNEPDIEPQGEIK